MEFEKKRSREKKVVFRMISIYCKGMKHSEDRKKLCPSCKELLEYASFRTDKCPRMATKTFCNNCEIQCYKSAMKVEIAKVMRYSGPRLLLYHPVLLMQHTVLDMLDRKRNKTKGEIK